MTFDEKKHIVYNNILLNKVFDKSLHIHYVKLQSFNNEIRLKVPYPHYNNCINVLQIVNGNSIEKFRLSKDDFFNLNAIPRVLNTDLHEWIISSFRTEVLAIIAKSIIFDAIFKIYDSNRHIKFGKYVLVDFEKTLIDAELTYDSRDAKTELIYMKWLEAFDNGIELSESDIIKYLKTVY